MSSTSLASGAQWSLEPAFHSEGQFNDNLLLTRPPLSAWVIKTGPSLGMSYATERMTLTFRPKFEYLRYFTDNALEDTFQNFFLPLSGSYRTEADSLGLDIAINRDNALIPELQETGLVTNLIPRNYRNVLASWERTLTERLTFQSSLQFTDVDYELSGPSFLFDYRVYAGSAGMEYEWSEITILHSTLWYSDYHVPQVGLRTQSPGVEIGFSHRIFETLTLTGSAGLRNVWTSLDSNGQSQTDSTLAWVFGASLEKEWERFRMTLEYNRHLNPSAFGFLLLTDRMNLAITHQLTHALTASLSGSVIMNETVGSSPTAPDGFSSRYWQVGPTLSWRMTEFWTWEMTYRHAQLSFDTAQGGPRQSNAGFLRLTYTWPKWVWSW